MITLNDTQRVTVVTSALDAANNPASSVPGILNVTTSDPSIFTIANVTDVAFDIVSVGAGSATVTASCLTPAGTVAFSKSDTVVVTGGVATQYSFSVGTPIPK